MARARGWDGLRLSRMPDRQLFDMCGAGAARTENTIAAPAKWPGCVGDRRVVVITTLERMLQCTWFLQLRLVASGGAAILDLATHTSQSKLPVVVYKHVSLQVTLTPKAGRTGTTDDLCSQIANQKTACGYLSLIGHGSTARFLKIWEAPC
jgi:hypothetical protein